MFRSIILTLGLVAVLVAGHEGHDDGHSAVVYTTVMVMDGMTTTMEMTATASEHSSATAAAGSSTSASGLAHPTSVPTQIGVAGIFVAALAGIGL
ncbi:uncharacterized protein CC84DRAFT_1223580 [Paraphaeosphaeria sporulosa]|uniref:Uncharacterized protein n=1 Tax=Paraphaeosphaeria sporulosa TaxID=1460663 RepID=A0A177BTV7_9PLEO|nr:uncharacterized protein CC84DRAFT_1223580 [Paraphaeosphaeria sporulosa]OAF98843.1 hypothetical protein CC84DRAFT_1223580 [Paraphaeosphaeria sporulosa]